MRRIGPNSQVWYDQGMTQPTITESFSCPGWTCHSLTFLQVFNSFIFGSSLTVSIWLFGAQAKLAKLSALCYRYQLASADS